jgi:hypothetical protein
MLRPVLAWRALGNLWTVYFFNFPFSSGCGEPRIMNQWIRGHDRIALNDNAFKLQIPVCVCVCVCVYHVCILSHSMEHSPSWEGNRFAASQEILCILWNPKVNYRIHKCPPPSLYWASSIQAIPLHPPSWRYILILSSHLHLGLIQWYLSLRFPHQNPVQASPHPHPSYIYIVRATEENKNLDSYKQSIK